MLHIQSDVRMSIIQDYLISSLNRGLWLMQFLQHMAIQIYCLFLLFCLYLVYFGFLVLLVYLVPLVPLVLLLLIVLVALAFLVFLQPYLYVLIYHKNARAETF